MRPAADRRSRRNDTIVSTEAEDVGAGHGVDLRRGDDLAGPAEQLCQCVPRLLAAAAAREQRPLVGHDMVQVVLQQPTELGRVEARRLRDEGEACRSVCLEVGCVLGIAELTPLGVDRKGCKEREHRAECRDERSCQRGARLTSPSGNTTRSNTAIASTDQARNQARNPVNTTGPDRLVRTRITRLPPVFDRGRGWGMSIGSR